MHNNNNAIKHHHFTLLVISIDGHTTKQQQQQKQRNLTSSFHAKRHFPIQQTNTQIKTPTNKMTNALLSLGCTLIAFSPSFTLLILFAYPKAQLIIVVTTSAFFYLLSSLAASIFNIPLLLLNKSNGGADDPSKWNAFYVIPISILSQFVFRCAFVKVYHKVESVIEDSIQSHEKEEMERREMVGASRRRSRNQQNQTGSGTENDQEDQQDQQHSSSTDEPMSESSLLRLELNEISCSIASGVGFATMHTILLYGTLLASENNRVEGTLYQISCSVMPSLIQSALMAFWFSILDIVWMMVTFYGMRMYYSNSGNNNQWSFGKNRVGGKAALSFVLITHLIASLSTSLNVIIPANGCIVSLPLLSVVSVGIVTLAWAYLKESFLPESQRLRIRQANHLD